MKLLLDTQAFIWWDTRSSKLSREAFARCEDSDNTLLLSVVSIWEMQIKLSVGKLQPRTALATIIAEQQKDNQLQVLPVILDHVLALDKLLLHHKDPFDRLLVAQAMVEDVALISNDSQLTNYPIKVIW